MAESPIYISWRRRVAAWLVHAFTASGVVFGLLALDAIHREAYIVAFWLMAVAIIIDAVDGWFARWAGTKEAAARVDGALLDNIVDYLNYVIVPAFFIMESQLLTPAWRTFAAGLIALTSAYQFSQEDAKTEDHFFKGFPSYWNILVFYLFFLQLSPTTNLIIILSLAVLIFVPIKYVYPSRLEYLTSRPWLRTAMIVATVIWGGATALLINAYPNSNRPMASLSLGYVLLYILVSLYRTLFPLRDATAS